MGVNRKPVTGVCETVEEFLRTHHLDPSVRESREILASMLEGGEVSCPLELRGDDISVNEQCEWDKKKAFINLYKHKISFEEVSKLYSTQPPPGYEVLYDDPTDTGTEEGSFWGFDIRDWVVAKIGAQGCIIIQVDRSHTVSGRVRLISARPVPQKAALDAIRDHELNSSVSVTARVIFNSFGGGSVSVAGRGAKSGLFRKIQAYENIRYLTAVAKKAF
jgi:uncharacterized DUF497 family protein